MKEFWEERYATKEFVYGKEPNRFFKQTIDEYKLKGKILLPAEGEGRNAIYAARKGLSVFALDISTEAKNKALNYAEEQKLSIHFQVGDFNEMHFKNNFFDAAALIYAHFPEHLRKVYHAKIEKLIKPNGIVFLEGFSVNNLKYRAQNQAIGGPDKKEMLFTKELIKNDFKGFTILKLEEEVINLSEGNAHSGKGSVIRFIGKKLM